MTKKLLYSIAIVAGLVSCKGDYDDWATPQSNAASETAAQFDWTITPKLTSINFEEENPETVELFSASNLQEGVATLNSYNVVLSDGASATKEIEVFSDGSVSVSTLEGIVEGFFGKKREPVEYDVYVTVTSVVDVVTADGIVSLKKEFDPFVVKATVKASKELYYVGDIGGWGMFFPMSEVDTDKFAGYYYIAKADNASTWGFKFTITPDWDNPQYGTGGSYGTLALGGGNADLPEGGSTGFYRIDVNLADLTYSVTPISTISLVGSAVAGDTSWGTDYDLTFNPETLAWEGTYDLVAGEFKFRANHKWDYSWGGTAADELTSNNGANLKIDADGTYKITFKPNCDGKGVYTIE